MLIPLGQIFVAGKISGKLMRVPNPEVSDTCLTAGRQQAPPPALQPEPQPTKCGPDWNRIGNILPFLAIAIVGVPAND